MSCRASPAAAVRSSADAPTCNAAAAAAVIPAITNSRLAIIVQSPGRNCGIDERASRIGGLPRKVKPWIFRWAADCLEFELFVAIETHLADQRTSVFALQRQHVAFEGVLTAEFLRLLLGLRELPGESRIVGQRELEFRAVFPRRLPRSHQLCGIDGRTGRRRLFGRPRRGLLCSRLTRLARLCALALAGRLEHHQ